MRLMTGRKPYLSQNYMLATCNASTQPPSNTLWTTCAVHDGPVLAALAMVPNTISQGVCQSITTVLQIQLLHHYVVLGHWAMLEPDAVAWP